MAVSASGRLTLLQAVLQLLLFATPTFSQICPSPPDPITTEAMLQAISNCTTITGDLIVGYRDCRVACHISSFSALDSLVEITGSLSVQCCPSLEQLSRFGSLTSLRGSLVVHYNQNLRDISGFGELGGIGNIRISQNGNLTAISGFGMLKVINGYLQLDRNTALSNMNGFGNLEVIHGDELVAGHALNILYNTDLQDLRAFRNLNNISYGTVHIEGNTDLCYAGYPQWREGSYASRPPSGDVGIDWRTRLKSDAHWQYTWGVDGFPTLVVQNNAETDNCGDASCHPSCAEGAGCLGPSDSALCGTCLQDASTDTCLIGPTPASESCDPTPIDYWPPDEMPYSLVFGVFFTFIAILVLALIGVGVYFGIKLFLRLRESRKGSFDINLGMSESTDSSVELIPTRDYHRPSSSRQTNSRTAGTIAEPTRGSALDAVVISSYREKKESISQEVRAPKKDAVVISSYREKKESISQEVRAPKKDAVVISSYREKKESVTQEARAPKKRRDDVAPPRRPSKSNPVVVASYKQKTGSMSSLTDLAPPTEQKPIEEVTHVPMNFPCEQVKLLKEFGTGDFGKVYQAEAKKLLPGQKKTSIVVKQLKAGASTEEKEAFLRPVEAMKTLQHPNVLSLLGVCTGGTSIMVMLEFCGQGNFKTFLVRKRPEAATIKQSGQMSRMSCDMAAGLMYLHSKNIAHNDFAARSCVVMGDGSVKVGDYGLSREIFKEDYYSRGPNQRAWPIRWMAPEKMVVKGRNSLDSMPASMPGNIWSFGVTLWEVCSFAQWPYEELTNEEVIVTVKRTNKCSLENPLPPNDPLTPLFGLMQQCWQPVDSRPSMPDLHGKLQDIKNNKVKPDRPVSPVEVKLVKPVQKDPPPTRRTSGDYKPRRPAPRRPPTQTSKPLKKRETSNEPLLGSSLSMEEEPFSDTQLSQSSTISLPEKKSRGLQHERKPSADPLLAGSQSQELPRRENPLFFENESKLTEDVHTKRETEVATRGFVIENFGATVGQEYAAGDMGGEDEDFILEPPEDFSQSSVEQEEDMDVQDNGIFYDFGPEYGVEDSPMVDRRDQERIRGQVLAETEEGYGIPRSSRKPKGAANPMWLSDDSQFDQFDHRDALQEEDIPNPVYNDEVSELLW